MSEHGAASGGVARPVALASPAPLVALWMCDLARSETDIASMQGMLSEAEHARAERFGLPELRHRYIVGRATLRTILGDVLGMAPADVGIVRGKRGRPHVEGREIDFNVSHTRRTALFGVTRGQRIGVDIEHRDRALNVDGVARKFMSPREREALALLDPEARRRMLLRLWTCKEAMSKATGDALSAPFGKLDVQLNPVPALVAGPPPYEPARWRLLGVDMPGGFLATAALWHDAPPQ